MKMRGARSLALALALTLLLGPTTSAIAKGKGSGSVGELSLIDALPWPKKVEVQIKNQLESRAELEMYCKDKSDVGLQEIGYDSTYSFTITEAVLAVLLKDTVYSCEFKWDNELHNFDIYMEKRDSPNCGSQCDWEIKEKGPCLVQTNMCFNWT